MPKSKSRPGRTPKHVAPLLLVTRCRDCGTWLFARGTMRAVSEHETKATAVTAARRVHDALYAGLDPKPHLFFVDDEAHATEELTGDELPSIH